MESVYAIITNIVIKPEAKDAEGYMKNPAFLALTFKVELDTFSDEALGNLLVNSAKGEEVFVSVKNRKFSAIMTQAAVKPETKDSEGDLKNPAYLATTFKAELPQFESEAELGGLLVASSTGNEVPVTIEPRQLQLGVNASVGEEAKNAAD